MMLRGSSAFKVAVNMMILIHTHLIELSSLDAYENQV